MFTNFYRRLPLLILSPMFCRCPANVLPFLLMWYRCAAVLVPIPENRQICAAVLLREPNRLGVTALLHEYPYPCIRTILHSWMRILKMRLKLSKSYREWFYKQNSPDVSHVTHAGLSWSLSVDRMRFINNRGRHTCVYRQEKERENKIIRHVQCVPIKRKPGLSVRYLHCYARFNQTVRFSIKGIFSSFILIPNIDDISMHEWKGTI